MSECVPVALGERSYEIHVGAGLLSHAGRLLKPFARGTVHVVTDDVVSKLHLSALLAALGEERINARPVVIPAGEGTKSFAGLESLISALLASGLERKSTVVAFGGGVVGDLAGLAAGLVKRGVDVVQIPTTLLAQVDSSVGGKTAINTAEGKNLVGLFHQPRLVIADTDLLATLPRRELLAGYAEIAKYGALGDAEFFSWLERSGLDACAGDNDAIVRAVAHSCRMKAEIVERDEREDGERALLNLGHTFGHALEAATGYSSQLLHGEAVAIGMALAFELSTKLGHCRREDTERLRRHLESMGLPTSIAAVTGPRPQPNDLLEYMRHDKKARGGELTFVLVKRIGEAFIADRVPEQAVRELLAD